MSTFDATMREPNPSGYLKGGQPRVNKRILLTGSEGVIGRHLKPALAAHGYDVVACDLKPETRGGACDIRDGCAVAQKLEGCSGIVHLAAVSRVARGEAEPDHCFSCNVDGTRAVIRAAIEAPQRPWLLFASSREVYGNPSRLPATECCPIAPVNVYGRSKALGETLIQEAQREGLQAAIVRLSNVYGCPFDYPDRVIPAFLRAALSGDDVQVRGSARCFDFTHVDDVVRGLSHLIKRLDSGLPPPILHLTSGRPISLGELAQRIILLSESTSSVLEFPAEGCTVSSFYGTSDRAYDELGWMPEIMLDQGLMRLVSTLRPSDFPISRRGDVTAATEVQAP